MNEDALLVIVILLGLLRRVEVEIRLAHDLPRILQAESRRHRFAAAHEPAVHILEIDPVRNVIQQGAQQVAFVSQILLDLLALRRLRVERLEVAAQVIRG